MFRTIYVAPPIARRPDDMRTIKLRRASPPAPVDGTPGVNVEVPPVCVVPDWPWIAPDVPVVLVVFPVVVVLVVFVVLDVPEVPDVPVFVLEVLALFVAPPSDPNCAFASAALTRATPATSASAMTADKILLLDMCVYFTCG